MKDSRDFAGSDLPDYDSMSQAELIEWLEQLGNQPDQPSTETAADTPAAEVMSDENWIDWLENSAGPTPAAGLALEEELAAAEDAPLDPRFFAADGAPESATPDTAESAPSPQSELPYDEADLDPLDWLDSLASEVSDAARQMQAEYLDDEDFVDEFYAVDEDAERFDDPADESLYSGQLSDSLGFFETLLHLPEREADEFSTQSLAPEPAFEESAPPAPEPTLAESAPPPAPEPTLEESAPPPSPPLAPEPTLAESAPPPAPKPTLEESAPPPSPPPAAPEPTLAESAPPPSPPPATLEPVLEESAPPATLEPVLEESAPPPAPEPTLAESAAFNPPAATLEPVLEESAPPAPEPTLEESAAFNPPAATLEPVLEESAPPAPDPAFEESAPPPSPPPAPEPTLAESAAFNPPAATLEPALEESAAFNPPAATLEPVLEESAPPPAPEPTLAESAAFNPPAAVPEPAFEESAPPASTTIALSDSLLQAFLPQAQASDLERWYAEKLNAISADSPPPPSAPTAPSAKPPPGLAAALNSARGKVAANDLPAALLDYEALLHSQAGLEWVVGDMRALIARAEYQENSAAHRVLGDALLRQGQLEAALQVYQQALALL